MSTVRGEETKRKTVKTAARLIHTRGYKNTSLEDILVESGVNKGSFYFHFSSKDELVHEVIDHFFSTIERRLESVSGSGRAIEKIETYLDLVMGFMERSGCAGGCLLGNLTLEVSDWHEDLRKHLSSCFERFIGILSRIVAEGQERGEIRADRSADDLAAFVIALMEGALLLSRVKKDISPFKKLSQDTIEFLKRETIP